MGIRQCGYTALFVLKPVEGYQGRVVETERIGNNAAIYVCY